ncbi:MAG: MmcQ/YjbR family DNA-binding protein [Bacteroidetes bacterium]|nr:MmcQ/YjbR family DNA-binding protein [Bacteroidota bacterium]MBS1756873.1 MmcQ/YjbR family DNA-binding protein [Bacteroidota bacterium]
MDAETIREYVLQKKDVTEGFPFGENALVFKTNNKMFLLLSLSSIPLKFNAKCEPDKAIELREEYAESILPGYHMNKKHWNTIILDGRVPQKIIFQLIDDSYSLVAKKIKK